MRKITLFFAALLISMTAFAANIVGGTKLYLKPGTAWAQGNERFAAYFYGGDGEKWVSMSTVTGASGVYEVEAPSGTRTNVIFCRMNGSNLTNSWDAKWDQTNDLTYDGTKNCYSISSSSNGKGNGSWSTYTPPVVTVPVVKFKNSASSYFVGEKFIPEVESQNVENPTYSYRVNGAIVEITSEGYTFDKAGKYTFEVDVKSNNEGEVLATAKYDVDVICKITSELTIYMTPSDDWKKDGARFAAYFFGLDGELWVDMTDADNDGVYEVMCTGTRSNVIFVRMKGSAATNNWDNKLDQTGDLTYDCENNHYSIVSKTWSKYTPKPVGVKTSWSFDGGITAAESGIVLNKFTNVVVAFSGVDSVGRDVTSVAGQGSSTNILFYEVLADGSLAPVENNGLMYPKSSGTTVTYSLQAKNYKNVETGTYNYLRQGNYRIVIDGDAGVAGTGDILFKPNRSGLPKVYNDQTWTFDFTIKNDYVAKYAQATKYVVVPAYDRYAPPTLLESLSEIIVTFPEYESIVVNATYGDNKTYIPCVVSENGANVEKAQMKWEAVAGTPNAIRIYADNAITNVGTYGITIPEGLVNFKSSATEVVYNESLALSYTVAKKNITSGLKLYYDFSAFENLKALTYAGAVLNDGTTEKSVDMVAVSEGLWELTVPEGSYYHVTINLGTAAEALSFGATALYYDGVNNLHTLKAEAPYVQWGMAEDGDFNRSVYSTKPATVTKQFTYSYTFASTQFSAAGTKTLNNVDWTLTTDAGYFGFDSNGKGQQIGSGNKPAKSAVLSTTGIEGKITKIVVNTSGASSIAGTFAVTVNGVAYTPESIKLTTSATDYEFTGAETGEIKFTWTQTSSKALYIKSINIEYEKEVAVDAVDAPVFSVEGGVKEEAFNLELTCATADAEIYYTLNGGAETKYTAAINIAATTTVKAWAVKGETRSEEVSATYTFLEYVENATIAQVLAAEPSDYVWYQMTGVIDSLYNTTYGNFNLVNGTEKILVYGLTATKVASNDKSFASLNLKEGDKITIWGTRSVHNGKPQVGGPAYFVEKVVEPTISATWDIEEGDTVADFTSATLTFTGVESAKAKSTYSNYFFYKVAEDGTATLVPSACSDGYMDATTSGTAVTFSIDKETCYLDMPQYGAMFGLTTGKYRIAVPVGAIQFNGDASNLNTEAYVLNFTYVAPKAPTQVETAYTVNPENNSTIAEIREVVINFTEYETIKVAEPDLATGANIPTVSTYMEDYGMSVPAGYMMFKADSLSANGLRLYVDPRYTGGMEAFATEGLYTITIPAGVVSFGSDNINQTITLTYTVGQVEEALPMEVEFENIAAIYEMGMWDMAYYESYSNYEVKAILKSQPTVVDKVVSSGMMGGSINNYYLNDGTGVIVLQAEGDRIEPILDENWEQIGNDTIPGLNIEIGKKLPANFFATIDFKTVIDDETHLPTGEVYGAPVMAYVPRETGDTIVEEDGWETIVTESNEDFAARCEASDFVEAAVEVSIDDLLANRIDYAGKLVVVDTTGNYYAESMMDHFSGVEKTTAYMYCGEATESFDVESYEAEGTTYVYVYPKFTEDYNNFAGTLFNLVGGEFTAAALDANVTIDMAKARFDWNSIAQGQSMIVKEYQIVTPGPGQDVENGELVVNIYSNNGSVYVETEAGAMIEVYTVNGLCVYAGVSNTNTTVINGLNTNIAIIRVNGEAYKVFVK